MDNETIVGIDTRPTTRYDYNKMAIISERLKGKDVILLDDGEEYKSIGDALGVEYTVNKPTN